MQAATGVPFAAAPAVADDNITLYCHERPLADILPQIARLFDFTWRRTGDKAASGYELTQTPLQIAQERGARERDKLSALAWLDRTMEERFRPLLGLSKAQLEDRQAHGKTPEERSDAGYFQRNCTPALYLSLSPSEKVALLRGEPLIFTASATNPGRIPSHWFQNQVANFALMMKNYSATINGVEQPHVTDAQILTAGDISTREIMRIGRDRHGKYHFDVDGTFFIPSLNFTRPALQGPFFLYTDAQTGLNNRKANAALASVASMQRSVTLNIKPTYARTLATPTMMAMPAPAATQGDYEEAVFDASGQDVIGDGFACLCAMKRLTTQPQPLFDALCLNSDILGLRWRSEDGWLTFRALGSFNQCVLQIPNRVLERWSASRREHGAATLDDIAEMAQPIQSYAVRPDSAEELSEPSGQSAVLPSFEPLEEEVEAFAAIRQAYLCYGLHEWSLAHEQTLLPHVRFLGKLSPDLRQLAATPGGLPFSRLPLNLRGEFRHLAYGAFEARMQPGLPELMNSVLRVHYKPVSRAKSALDAKEQGDTSGSIVTTIHADGTSTEAPAPPMLQPDWDLKFVYTFGSKRTGKFRHTIEPHGFNFSEPGEIKD